MHVLDWMDHGFGGAAISAIAMQTVSTELRYGSQLYEL